jgi:hypothetical protein
MTQSLLTSTLETDGEVALGRSDLKENVEVAGLMQQLKLFLTDSALHPVDLQDQLFLHNILFLAIQIMMLEVAMELRPTMHTDSSLMKELLMKIASHTLQDFLEEMECVTLIAQIPIKRDTDITAKKTL